MEDGMLWIKIYKRNRKSILYGRAGNAGSGLGIEEVQSIFAGNAII